ncbi:translational activator of cytochrome c oxidase 1 [Xyrichtys novacula]|uniref:Translational activator of cytochrome c oxidase 1 n=1 Tax=Xyrichtys novacula TaxID=13765 RepID=A0AAV1H4Y4_XYRNO|nr:translational activator of cytochrome c oxidase 1 [Xyrichtys novacula]
MISVTVFSRHYILVLFAEGGPNPDSNLNLAQILERCKAVHMPKSTIEAALKPAEKSKPVSQHMLEARGPGGCLLLIEVLTDNTLRTTCEIKHLLRKNGWMMSDKVSNTFDRKGVLAVLGKNLSMEQALELAIEAGAEDVTETSDEEEQSLLQFTCDMAALRKVRVSLTDLGMQITSAGLEYVPRTLTPLNQDQLESASSIIDILNDCPYVVRIWDNIEAES